MAEVARVTFVRPGGTKFIHLSVRVAGFRIVYQFLFTQLHKVLVLYILSIPLLENLLTQIGEVIQRIHVEKRASSQLSQKL